MRTDHRTRCRFAIVVSAALLTSAPGGCASEPKPRPTALDPSNPAAPESQPLAVSALGPTLAVAATPAASDPAKEVPGAPPSEAENGHKHDVTASPQAKDPSGEGGRAGHQPSTIYTCPMHPEVTSDKPGRCPKCGMTLVPKDAGEGKK
jgi:Heavy metal binding domain